MLKVPSVLGIISTNPNAKRLTVKHALVRPNRTRGRQRLRRVVSTTIYKRRTAQFKSRHSTKPEPEECCIHRHCDLLYQNFTPAQKAVWKDAVKAPRMSAYDLWMSECLTACLLHEPAPDAPSISGGWSTGKVQPGTGEAPEWCWEAPPVHSPAASYTIERDWEDPWLRFNFSAVFNDWAWELAPELQFVRIWYWNVHTATWLYANPQGFDEFPSLMDFGQDPAMANFTLSWPYWPPHLITSPIHDPGTWTDMNPNFLPWTPPPLPPDPWPNPPA